MLAHTAAPPADAAACKAEPGIALERAGLEPPGQAADDLLPLVYAELRRLAAAQLAALWPGQTLQPTALVHEAYLKLAGADGQGWQGRGHFFATAALAMREIIVDAARRKAARKRGGGVPNEALDEGLDAVAVGLGLEEVIAVDRALKQLEALHPRQGQVVALRYFSGLSEEEIAGVLGITARTVQRDWRFARAWLHQAMTESA
jgi:RNA polymerase sigma factor (TIGR02999 family)